MDSVQSVVAPVTVAGDLGWRDLRGALGKGVSDFLAYPLFGLFFASFYVAGGIILMLGLSRVGETWWLIALMAGFPLLAPFTAVGLYEVSRRRERGEPMRWGAVLGSIWARAGDQLGLMGALVFIAFSFWMGLAHGVFAIFMGTSGVGAQSLAELMSPDGVTMLLVGGAMGGLFALAMFAITVMSLPMLVDREVDFITAIITSLAVVRSNKAVMIGWALIIAVLMAAAMVPMFLGLFVVLPVLGHATWHLYRRSVRG
nr:DUF2189 domain-containing protein [uncultured Sphingomonas sp.]